MSEHCVCFLIYYTGLTLSGRSLWVIVGFKHRDVFKESSDAVNARWARCAVARRGLLQLHSACCPRLVEGSTASLVLRINRPGRTKFSVNTYETNGGVYVHREGSLHFKDISGNRDGWGGGYGREAGVWGAAGGTWDMRVLVALGPWNWIAGGRKVC